MRAFCASRQRIFYAPKQLIAEDAGSAFADAEAEYVLNYTNNLIKLLSDGEVFFFKEAKTRLVLPAHLDRSVREFFTDICPDAQLFQAISESLKKRANRNKLLRMGNKDERGAPLHVYLTEGDERVLGLPAIPSEKKDVARKFIFYVYGELNGYLYNYGVKRGDRQTFLAVRAIAVKKLADLLGIGHLIPETRYVKLRIGEREKYGVLERNAAGADLSNVPLQEREKHVTPRLLRELTALNVLDVLCHDDDHRVNNYHTVTDGSGDYTGVMSYDNDGPNVFLPTASVRFRNSVNCSEFIDKCGFVNRPHMDRSLADAILGLEKSSLAGFNDCLTRLQRACLWSRIRKLQRAIVKTGKRNADFLLDGDGWTEEHLREELSGRYGKTYLKSFLSDCYYPDGLHPFDVC